MPPVLPQGSLLARDLDGDGDVDLVTAGQRERGDPAILSVVLNRGDGSFAAPSVQEFQGGGPTQLVAADLNGDGSLEIVTALYLPGQVAAILEVRDGAFESAGEVPVGHGVVHLAARDIDRDGDTDLVSGALGSGVSGILNATNQELTRGCEAFLRGDVNADGAVSVSDMVALRRYIFSGTLLECDDAADVNDDERIELCDVIAYIKVLFRSPDWPALLQEPFPVPGADPTRVGVGDPEIGCAPPDPDDRLGCAGYAVEPAVPSGDLLRIGDVVAFPGGTVRIPVFLSASVPVDAVQLVLAYDTDALEIAADALSYERTVFEQFDEPPRRPGLSELAVHPEHGVLTAAIAGDLIHTGYEIPPGEDILIAWIAARVSEDVAPGSVLTLTPTNGQNGEGVGPYRLRNELTHNGQARYLSLLPELEEGRLEIVGDQSVFVVFVRGDSNGDSRLELSDSVHTLGFLFRGGTLDCRDAADSNDDGRLDLSDGIFPLRVLFQGGGSMPPPYPDPGLDHTPDELDCQRRQSR